MVGAGVHVFAVWNYVIAKTRRGFVELNPVLLAFILGTNEAVVETAIQFLCAEDPKSRNATEGGRRLVREGQFQYRVVNWISYDGIRSSEDLKRYNREKKRQSRLRRSLPLPGESAAVRAWERGDILEAERLAEPNEA